jgi:very-short-patch-repair endonuclease
LLKPVLPNRTAAEKLFAKALKSKKINFLHNILLEGYEVDFYLPDYKIVIEIDGYHHLGYTKQSADLRKEKTLIEYGFAFFRVTNQQIRDDLSKSLLPIETYIKNYKSCTLAKPINTEWKDSLSRIRPEDPPALPKKFRTVEEYFLSLDDE